MTPEEYLIQVSPNDELGIRADLKANRAYKHFLDLMDRYAINRVVASTKAQGEQALKQSERIKELEEDVRLTSCYWNNKTKTELSEQKGINVKTCLEKLWGQLL